MRRPLVLLLPFLLAAFFPARAQQTDSVAVKKRDEASVSGTVVTLAGSEPLRKARVLVQSTADRMRMISATTDPGGHFEIKGLQPGPYQLTVSRVGYVTQKYGQRKPTDPGATLTLRPSQELKDLQFRMIPSAVIAGRVLDEDGEPLPDVTVSALRETYDKGKRSLFAGASVQSNDLGEYRLFGLAPGRYFVSARLESWRHGVNEGEEQAQSSSQGYAKMYYPGVPDRSRASTIAIKSGEEIPSTEILMRQVLVYHIRGHVYNQVTHRPGADSYVLLLPKTPSQQGDFADSFTMVQKRDGSFDIHDVLPGSYIVTSFWSDQGKNYLARVPVEVGNADVDGISLNITPGAPVNGRVIWDGQPALDKDDLSIRLETTDNSLVFHAPSRVNSDGSFSIPDVSDGSFNVVTFGESKDCYIKDIVYAGHAALEDGFNFTRGSAALLEITISSRGARVQGTVTDDDGLPAPGVYVALVPDSEARRAKHRLYKSITTDQYGHFDLRGIAPGEYLLFSWTDIEEGAWEDPDFMKEFIEKKKGESISLQEGDTKSMNLVALKTSTTEQPKQ
jgi:protocatechuate 3,4-dioxygenase beta subunit